MDIQFSLILSSLSGATATAMPNNQLLLRFLSGLPGEDSNFSPIVQKIRELKHRNESFNKDLLIFIRKTKENFSELSKELESIKDDDEDHIIIEQLKEEININQKAINTALINIEPTIKSQVESISKLSEIILPTTELAFKEKVLKTINANKTMQVSNTKKNRCTICLDSDANVMIKRTCIPPTNTTPQTTTSTPTSPTINRTTATSVPSTNTTNSPIQTTTTTINGIRHRITQINGPTPLQYLQQAQQQQQPRRNTFCEKAVCACGPVTCRDCLITHYWSSTSNGLKSYSTCVCCRSEFCIKDIYNVEYINEDQQDNKEKESLTIKDDNNKKPTTQQSSTTSTTTTSTSTPPSKKRKDDSDNSKDNKRYKENVLRNNSNNINDKDNDNSNKKNKKKTDNSDENENEDDENENDHTDSANNKKKSGSTFKNLINFWK